MLAPVGAPGSRLKVSTLAGISASLADTLKVNSVPSLIVWLAIAASTGAAFASLTTTLKVLLSLRLGVPLSVTRTVTVFVLALAAPLGFQLSPPLLALMVMPAGTPGFRLYVSVLAGTSASVAVAVSVNGLSSLTVWSAITASTGALFTSFTTTVK